MGTACNELPGRSIVVGIVMVAVHDEDYQTACQKLKHSAFREIIPERTIPPEILSALPDPDEALEEVKKEFQRLDSSTTTFEYPINHHLAGSIQLTLAPNSFANLPIPNTTGDVKQSTAATKGYDIYGNICHPLEQALVESFVKCVVDDKNDENAEFSGWGDRLGTWVAMMCGYLEVNNDILDSCRDERAVEWFSVNYGRIHEEKFGPLDRPTRFWTRNARGHEGQSIAQVTSTGAILLVQCALRKQAWNMIMIYEYPCTFKSLQAIGKAPY